MKLIHFELKKVIENKKTYIIFLLFVGLVIGLFLRNVSMQSFIKNEALETVQSHLRTTYSNISLHQAVLEKLPEDENAKQLLDMSNDIKHLLYDLRTAISANDWEQQLTVENAFLREVELYKALDGEFLITETDIHETIALNEKLLQENIPPEHHTYSIATTNFLKVVMDVFMQLGALIIVVLLIGDLITTEFEQHSIQFLLTQPTKRGAVLLSKFLVRIGLYVATALVAIVVSLGIGYVFGNKGTFDYPILMTLNDEIAFITIFEYIVYGLTLLTVLMFFVIALYLLCSLLFKQTIIALLILFVVLLTGYVTTASLSIAWINPFRNLFPEGVILHQNNSLWYEGIPGLLILALLCYGVAYFKIKSVKTG